MQFYGNCGCSACIDTLDDITFPTLVTLKVNVGHMDQRFSVLKNALKCIDVEIHFLCYFQI